MDFDVGRQNASIQLLGLGLHSLQDVLCLLAAKHEDHALNRVVILLITELAESRRMADHDVANVLDANRNAVAGADDDVANIAGVTHQSNAAHVIKLPTLGVKSTSRIGIIGAQCVHDCRNGQVVAINSRGIEQHLVLHGGAAESGIIGHTGDGPVSPLDHPVLKNFQFLRAAIGTLQHIPINQAAGTEERSHGRGHSRGQGGLRDSLEDDLSRKVVVGILLEGQAHIGEPIERDGPHHHHVWHAVHLQLDGKRDQALNFFRSVARPLRDEFDLRRREVGIRVHGHAPERDDARDHHEACQHQHQKALTQRRLYDAMDHSGLDSMVLITVC